jgi:hypothetical protein
MQALRYCTFAETDPFALSLNVQLRALAPLLEHAPDQIASRLLETDSVMLVPVANAALPVLPTATLMPAGVDVTRSPLRPVAATVSVALPVGGGELAGGFTVRFAERLVPA